jgi:hypothetical protein
VNTVTTLPDAERQTLEGQSHEVAPEVLTLVLAERLRGAVLATAGQRRGRAAAR